MPCSEIMNWSTFQTDIKVNRVVTVKVKVVRCIPLPRMISSCVGRGGRRGRPTLREQSPEDMPMRCIAAGVTGRTDLGCHWGCEGVREEVVYTTCSPSNTGTWGLNLNKYERWKLYGSNIVRWNLIENQINIFVSICIFVYKLIGQGLWDTLYYRHVFHSSKLLV